ncbi:hypothetical protein ACFXAF_13825 [Kitasatospora sp. NPDC059463]|uniref:hypothetical protein n=1 Tax=unclassified Kitasatospora TaxID=2633591 RepID=UPI0036ACBC64
MTEALLPVLQASCPQDAGGYGGFFQVHLTSREGQALVHPDRLRSAAGELGWKVPTHAGEGVHGSFVVPQDIRPVPAEHADAVGADRLCDSHEAAERVSALLAGPLTDLGPGSAGRQIVQFRRVLASLLIPVAP